MEPTHPANDMPLPENPVSHILVTCANFGAHELCNDCGARMPHLNTSCEPCPVDKVNHCAAAILQNVPGAALYTEGWETDSTDQPIEEASLYHVFPAVCGEDENKVLVFKSRDTLTIQSPEPDQRLHRIVPIHQQPRRFRAKNSTVKLSGKKQGRNDACACGSGKKFKFCCGKTAKVLKLS